MADIPTENMVLRTLYIPLETDRQLKALAFTREVSKGELMRELIKQGLATIAASGERSLVEQLSARLAPAKIVKPTKAKAPAKASVASSERGASTRAQGSARKPRELIAAGRLRRGSCRRRRSPPAKARPVPKRYHLVGEVLSRPPRSRAAC